jgi:hypothetical protein
MPWRQDQRFFLLFLIGSGGSRIRIGITMQLAGRPPRIPSLIVITWSVREVLLPPLETLAFLVRDSFESAIILVL